jgi:hypothetical protein
MSDHFAIAQVRALLSSLPNNIILLHEAEIRLRELYDADPDIHMLHHLLDLLQHSIHVMSRKMPEPCFNSLFPVTHVRLSTKCESLKERNLHCFCKYSVTFSGVGTTHVIDQCTIETLWAISRWYQRVPLMDLDSDSDSDNNSDGGYDSDSDNAADVINHFFHSACVVGDEGISM